MDTTKPTRSAEDDSELMFGVPTLNEGPLLATSFTVTETVAVFAVRGTAALIMVGLQLLTLAIATPIFRTLEPCEFPNPVPDTLIEVPGGPELGVMIKTCGITVKLAALLATPLTMTTT